MSGTIAGTLQYMSPEQLQGKEADPRSDIFSFGCVFYEMLSGKRAFDGESVASIIGAVLHREPEPIEIGVPLARLIRRCMEKDPDERFQTARDLKYNLVLAEEMDAPASATAVVTPSRWRQWSAATVLVGLVCGFAGLRFAPSKEIDTSG